VEKKNLILLEKTIVIVSLGFIAKFVAGTVVKKSPINPPVIHFLLPLTM
jgi:hypothetical protein